jgi:erythromycin esterase-like protein
VLAILDEQPKGTRMVVWAENSHVRDTRDPSLRRMGSRLREKLGRDDAILGFVFDQGTFLAEVANADPKARKGPVEVRVGPAPAGTVESALARAENPLAAYDLARLPSDAPATKWLSDPRGMREAGSVFTTESALVKEVTPSRAFDALVFVAKVAPVHPLAKIEPKDK